MATTTSTALTVHTALQRAGGWRFADLAELPDDLPGCYEVVDGNLVVSPPPAFGHQAVASTLLVQLTNAAPPTWVGVAEAPLPLGDDGRVPDVAVVSTASPWREFTPAYGVGPEHFGLVVEVVSPSSRKTDRFAKPGEYAEAGIPLFWRVETSPELLLLAFRLVDGAYREVARVTDVGDVPAPWGPVTIDLRPLQQP